MTEAERELKEFEGKAKKYFEEQIDHYAYLADLNDAEENTLSAAICRERMNYMIYAFNRVGAMPVEDESE